MRSIRIEGDVDERVGSTKRKRQNQNENGNKRTQNMLVHGLTLILILWIFFENRPRFFQKWANNYLIDSYFNAFKD